MQIAHRIQWRHKKGELLISTDRIKEAIVQKVPHQNATTDRFFLIFSSSSLLKKRVAYHLDILQLGDYSLQS